MATRTVRRMAAWAGRTFRVSGYGKALAVLILVQASAVWAIKHEVYRKSLLTSDMALSCNTFWNTNFIDQFLYTDILYFEYGYRSLLNLHFCPTLLLLAPVYWVFPTPVLLLLVQTVMPGITVALVYRLGLSVTKGKGPPRLPLPAPWLTDFRLFLLGFSAAYLFHTYQRMATIGSVYGFQPDSAIPPLTVATALSLSERKWRPYFILLLSLFGLKENMPILGALLGLGLVMAGGEYRKRGAITVALAIFFLLAGLVLLPAFTGVGNKNVAILGRLTPAVLISNLRVLWPWGGLLAFLPAALAPEVLILTVPELVMYTAAEVRPFDWHVFPTLGIVAVATVWGMSRLMYGRLGWPSRLWRVPHSRAVFLGVSMALFLGVTVRGGHELFSTLRKHYTDRREDVDQEALNQVRPLIPFTASLATTSDLMVWFGNRPHLLSPMQYDRAEYLLVNVRPKGIPYRYAYDIRMVKGLAASVEEGAVHVIRSVKGRDTEMFLLRRVVK